MRMKNWLLFLMIPVIGTGCATMDPTSRTIVGSQVGMLAGTVTGAVIGHGDRFVCGIGRRDSSGCCRRFLSKST